jgi:hypothetical protein
VPLSVKGTLLVSPFIEPRYIQSIETIFSFNGVEVLMKNYIYRNEKRQRETGISHFTVKTLLLCNLI